MVSPKCKQWYCWYGVRCLLSRKLLCFHGRGIFQLLDCVCVCFFFQVLNLTAEKLSTHRHMNFRHRRSRLGGYKIQVVHMHLDKVFFVMDKEDPPMIWCDGHLILWGVGYWGIGGLWIVGSWQWYGGDKRNLREREREKSKWEISFVGIRFYSIIVVSHLCCVCDVPY